MRLKKYSRQLYGDISIRQKRIHGEYYLYKLKGNDFIIFYQPPQRYNNHELVRTS